MTSTPALPALERVLAVGRMGAVASLAGRAVLLGRGVFYLLVIALLATFWDRVAAERLPGTLAPLLPAGGLAVYVGVTEWITLSVPAIHLRLEDDIRSGAIETHLLRPASYPLLRIAESCGGLLVRQGMLGAIGVVALLLSVTCGAVGDNVGLPGRAWRAGRICRHSAVRAGGYERLLAASHDSDLSVRAENVVSVGRPIRAIDAVSRLAAWDLRGEPICRTALLACGDCCLAWRGDSIAGVHVRNAVDRAAFDAAGSDLANRASAYVAAGHLMRASCFNDQAPGLTHVSPTQPFSS